MIQFSSQRISRAHRLEDENNLKEVGACSILFFHVLFIGSLRSRNSQCNSIYNIMLFANATL